VATERSAKFFFGRYRFAAMAPLALALQQAMAERGLTTADLAADTGIPVGTIRNLVAGRTAQPRTREVRHALDRYFAKGVPGSPTLDICEGRATRYPISAFRALVVAAHRLPEDLLEAFTTIAAAPPGVAGGGLGWVRRASTASALERLPRGGRPGVCGITSRDQPA
jgi:hypothetical protein